MASRLEQLSGIPVNYEDVRCDFAGDQKDVTAQNLTPAQKQVALQSGMPLAKQLIPLGGPLQSAIAVDASSGKLLNAPAAAEAWSRVLLAYKASGSLPGAFRLEAYKGSFFLEPTEMRDSTGATVAVSPVLSTPVTISVVQANAGATLNQILAQVSKASGFNVGVGMVPINGLAMGKVTIDAIQEPASHVLAELLRCLLGYGSVLPESSPAFAYRVLYDPGTKYYFFNVVEVGTPPGVRYASPAQPQSQPAAAPVSPPWFAPTPTKKQ